MKESATRELISAFVDVGGSYENVHLAISINNRPRKRSSEFLAKIYHSHAYYEFFYILNEGLTLSAKEMADTPLRAGDICIIPPFCEHYTTLLGHMWEEHPSLFLVTGFTIYDNHLNTSRNLYKILRARFENGGAPLVLHEDEFDTGGVLAALKSFRKNVEGDRSRLAFLDYCRALELIATDGKAEKPPLSKSDIIAKIDSFLSAYYMYDIKLTEIAECFYISAHTLNRLISEYYNDTFHNLLIRRRMQIAASYLANTDDSVASIAEKAGYSSLNNFYTAFKRHHGMLPADYRREMQKKEN